MDKPPHDARFASLLETVQQAGISTSSAGALERYAAKLNIPAWATGR
jgi:hypothetical protein